MSVWYNVTVLDWYVCIPVGAGTSVIVSVWDELSVERSDGIRLAAYVRARMTGVAIGVIALMIGAADHSALQWLQVLGAGIAGGSALAVLCTAFVVLMDRVWVIVPVAALLLAGGALVLAVGAHHNSWCLREGSLDTLGDCLGALFGVLLGWAVIGMGATLGLVFVLHRLFRRRSHCRTKSIARRRASPSDDGAPAQRPLLGRDEAP